MVFELSIIRKPIIETIYFEKDSINQFKRNYQTNENKKYILDYPTVYIVSDESKQKYDVYVGETSDIYRRTIQHMVQDPTTREDWRELANSETAEMMIIGHEYFNKSLTLDIENRLMLYLSSVENVKQLYNRRSNQQNEYYTSEKFEEIFTKVWKELHRKNSLLFPVENVIKDSAVFKASPFHKLTREQINAKEEIKAQILEVLKTGLDRQLILVTGAAGSGKTVLLSSLFYELFQDITDEDDQYQFGELDNYLLVNHDQQLTVYREIARKLNLINKQNNSRVGKPTSFINSNSPDKKVDVILVDEAHLLWTQGKQSYQGKNQLIDLLDRAKVVVAVFDIDQVLNTNQYWEQSSLESLESYTAATINLEKQMRINSSPQTVRWIRNIVDEYTIGEIPEDPGYDLRIFDNPQDLENSIREKAIETDRGLSRIIATFDWKYVQGKKPENENCWMVRDKDWAMPWNLQLEEEDKVQKRKNKGLSWAEQPHTINEVGSTYTIQGFDLNYAGLIIGPSVQYRNGKVVFNRDGSQNKNATQKRTMQDGSSESLAETLLKNELNVLLTRGVNGLYIYAVDEGLRNALLNADRRSQY